MAMTNRNNIKRDGFIFSTIEDIVPQEHLVRKLENCIDFRFLYPKVKHLYSEIGRPSIDPVVLFKMILINIIFGIGSMRKTCKEIEVNLAYRWFLGMDMQEKVPNYSTWSQNYIRRYSQSGIFEEVFDEIIRQARSYDFIDTETVFGDSTHQKANANKNKSHNEEVVILRKHYEEELLKEINDDRELCGKKPYDSTITKEIVFDEETGEAIEIESTKRIKVSNTDSESGNYHKGEKEKCFAYSHQTFCDKNGFVLSVTTVPGNIHDSSSFFDAYNTLNDKYKDEILNVCLDSGYKTPAICKTIIDNNQIPYLPYKRPMTKEGFFKKYEYIYDEDYDVYLCPNNEELSYVTTTRKGYRQYKSDPTKCETCPLLEQCTKSKNHTKLIQRHVWESYIEQAEEIRHTTGFKEIYKQRKETIERTFGDCKENHGLRYTRLRGLQKNQDNAWLIFLCHNLKKMGLWRWKYRENRSAFRSILDCFNEITENMKKVASQSIGLATLSTV